mmetsp:Transcript_12439/g.34923  ORF Transcript_12439/g.34923 Transcript_12439/m.34923 type:complete len:259 (-) Transcript_12439:2970-3746(-)
MAGLPPATRPLPGLLRLPPLPTATPLTLWSLLCGPPRPPSQQKPAWQAPAPNNLPEASMSAGRRSPPLPAAHWQSPRPAWATSIVSTAMTSSPTTRLTPGCHPAPTPTTSTASTTSTAPLAADRCPPTAAPLAAGLQAQAPPSPASLSAPALTTCGGLSAPSPKLGDPSALAQRPEGLSALAGAAPAGLSAPAGAAPARLSAQAQWPRGLSAPGHLLGTGGPPALAPPPLEGLSATSRLGSTMVSLPCRATQLASCQG